MPATDHQRSLNAIRNKRWQLWAVFISYLPAIAITLKTTSTTTAPIIICGLWVIMAAIGGVRVSFSRCPRCDNLFHMRGVSTSWGRSCRHCQLHL